MSVGVDGMDVALDNAAFAVDGDEVDDVAVVVVERGDDGNVGDEHVGRGSKP